MIQKIQIFMEKYHMIKKGGRIMVGVSGGADSVCLLLVLHELEKVMGFSLAAVHVEHGIRGTESLADAAFTEELCVSLGVPFRRFSVDAPGYSEQTHQSVEEAARELRYGCFARACAELHADRVAVAHHANDSAETMLFHLARGTGIRGLGGIAPIVNHHVDEGVRGAMGILPAGDDAAENGRVRETEDDFAAWNQENARNVCVIRPLLCVTRAEIEDYLSACGQAYRTDSTNEDMAYSRNRIRGRILPELAGVNAQAVAHMGKTARQLREICAYLDEAAFCEGAKAYEVIYVRMDAAEREKPYRKGHFADEGNQGLFIEKDMACMKECMASEACGAGENASPIERIRIFSQPFLAMHRVLRATLAHYLTGLIAGSEKDVTSGHVEQVLELFAMREGKRTDLPYGISARRLADGVELYHRENWQKIPDGAYKNESSSEEVLLGSAADENGLWGADVSLDLPVPGELVLDNGAKFCTEIFEFDGNFEKIPKKRYTKWMDYDKIKNTVQLRTRRPGDYLQIDAQGGQKKLKRYFIDEKIPAKEREGMPLVAVGSHVLWVVGHRISEGCKVTAATRRVLCLQYFAPQIIKA